MRHPARRGITMMETAIGSLLVGGVLASTLNLVGPTVQSTQRAGDRLTAAVLATDMLDEICALPFVDPQHDNGNIGPNPGEAGGTRDLFDDVDDYHGWTSAPQTRAGDALEGVSGGWEVRVSVHHVVASNPGANSLTQTGVKRITVRVSRNGVVLAERQALRTRSFDASRGVGS